MVRPIEYLRWHKSHRGGSHDLATSDQQAVAGEWGVVPEVLADRSDPPEDVTLEDQLAAVYDVDPGQVLVAAGATHANLAAFATALGEDLSATAPARDGSSPHVLVEAPGYEPLRATPAWLGATVHRYRRPAEEGFPLSADRIDAAAGEATELVVATNRHNPSGRRVDRETLSDAAAAARDNGAHLLVDEVYAPFGEEATDGPFGGPTAAGIDGTVVTGSLTKFFGLGGLRVGWLVADQEFVDRARPFFGHVPCLSTPGMALGRRALSHREDLEPLAREQLRTNSALLSSFVAGRDDLVGPVFDGSTYGFLQHVGPDGEPTDGDVVTEVAAEHDCTVVPGRFFESPNRVRVSLGGSPDEMAAALSALGEALDEC